MLFLHLLQGLFFNCEWPGLPEDTVVALIKVHFRNKLKVVWRFWCGFWLAASWIRAGLCLPASVAKGSTGQQAPPRNGAAPGRVGSVLVQSPGKAGSSLFGCTRRRATQCFGNCDVDVYVSL